MQGLTIEDLKKHDLIIFEAIGGSRAYGLDTPESDTDIRGVYCLPLDGYLMYSYQEQVNDATNDVVYYELGKFIKLLCGNNPNMLEMLNMPKDCVLKTCETFEKIKAMQHLFITKVARHAFAGYAIQQVEKSKRMHSSEKRRNKNLMHCIRLIRMSEEMAATGEVNVRRKDRDYLLTIRRGEFDFDVLIAKLTIQVKRIDSLFLESDLVSENLTYEEMNEMVATMRSSAINEPGKFDL